MMRLVERCMDALFGCRHQDLSRPFTIERRTYKVCLDCGRELNYSMRTMSFRPERAPSRQPATVLSFTPRTAAAAEKTSVAA